jgi:hypothetical protein
MFFFQKLRNTYIYCSWFPNYLTTLCQLYKSWSADWGIIIGWPWMPCQEVCSYIILDVIQDLIWRCFVSCCTNFQVTMIVSGHMYTDKRHYCGAAITKNMPANYQFFWGSRRWPKTCGTFLNAHALYTAFIPRHSILKTKTKLRGL